MSARTVAVLFARADSVYKGMAGCEVWDAEREHTPLELAAWMVAVARQCRIPVPA